MLTFWRFSTKQLEKTLKILIFLMLLIIFYMRFKVLVHKLLKNSGKKNVSGNVLFSHIGCFFVSFFFVLVSNTLINNQKTLFLKSRFLSPYRVFCLHFGVLVPDNVKYTQNTCFWKYCYFFFLLSANYCLLAVCYLRGKKKTPFS